MPWPDEPCPTCPRVAKGLSGPCRAMVRRNPRYCELTDPGHPAYKSAYVALLCDEPTAPPPGPKAEPPPMLERAASFVGAVLKHVAAGAPAAGEELKEARLAICRSNRCGRYAGDSAGPACLACGCGARGLATKAGWADQSCPLDPPLWGPAGR